MRSSINRSQSAIARMGWKLQEAQVVLTSQYDTTCVCGWLSKDGILYFRGGMDKQNAQDLEKELQNNGYKVIPRFGSTT